ncbi:hypothetical protein [Nitrospirillum iridis]|uniref:Uncharacterized protein n=1 Tax=Nitrospirillum iridis TaxID=765888 RepID=A0A7X0AXQ3_9PROT|nr:hypothetical protein [Nitrospirillum iridis]MBB6251020.1 hypothetical protein [Nitrospirillum iridis]
MVRLPLLSLLAFLTLVALVTGWSPAARAHECGPGTVTTAASAHAATTPTLVATAATDCHAAVDCCCAGGMAGCAMTCAGALVPGAVPSTGRLATALGLLPAGDTAGAGLALAPALGPPRHDPLA